MKKFILPILIVIIGGLAYTTSKKNSGQLTPTNEAVMDVGEQQQDEGSFIGSIKDVMNFGETQRCTWLAPEQGEGTVYVDGKNTRSEFTMFAIEDQPTQQMFSISDVELAYTWNPATKKGMKVRVDEIKEDASGMEQYKEEVEDEGQIKKDDDYQNMVNQDYEFKCESWKADPSLFIPPTDVDFIDMNVMVDEMKQDLQGMKKICDMLTGTEKTECLAGFEE